MEYVSQTKQQLADSLKELMCHTPFNKITVQNVTSSCGLNRQTFYYHFKDMYELLSWIYNNDILNEIMQEQDESWEIAVMRLMRYAKSNRTFCRNTARCLKKEDLEDFLQPVIHKWVENMAVEITNSYYISKEDISFIVDLFSTAFVSYAIQWVSRGMQEDEEFVIEKINVVIRMLYHGGSGRTNRLAI